MYDIENYYQAESVKDAVRLLNEHPDARIISGGSDVLIKIREGKFAGTSLVSIHGIKEIQGVKMADNGDIYIGAGTVFSHITNDAIIRKYIPVLGEAVDQVGGPQVRNIGTIGGNICNGAVSADSAPTVFSLNALLRLEDGKEGRLVPVKDFYLGPGRVDLRQGEILTYVIIPAKEYEGYHGHYIKYSMRNAMDIATISCSVGSKGMKIEESLYEKTAQLIREEINPRDSWRASRAFRLQIGGEIAARALRRTVELAGGDRI